MRRIRNLFPGRRDRLEQDLDREIRDHLDRRAADLMASGLAETEARRLASIEFGGMAKIQEEVRETWFWRWARDIARDVRYASRVLVASPGFTATAVLSLALGIGANTAIFSILHALVLRSLPVADPHRLVVVTRNETVSSPYPLFAELRDHSRTLAGVLAFRTAPMRLSKDGDPERVTGVLVSGTYFDVLGIRPAIGTVISNEDDQIRGAGGRRGPVAMLSHGYWLRRFGGEAAVIGTRILLNEHPFMIVGVGPPGFAGTEVGETADVFAPMMMQEALLPGLGTALTQPRSQWLRIFGRLSAGAGPRQAEAELSGLLRTYNQEFFLGPDLRDDARRRRLLEQKIVLLPAANGISQLRSQYSEALWVLSSVVMLVLLIACANIASLMLSRAAARRREIAIRLSLGASRSRLVGQLFTESLLVSVAGAGSGLVLARWMRDVLIGYLPPEQTVAAPMEPTVLVFTLVLGVGAALLFGLAPALQSTSVDVAPAIKGEGAAAASSSRAFFRKGLVVFQVSLSCMLLIAASLFLRSLRNVAAVDSGFARENILIASVEGVAGLDGRLLKELRSLPGVVSAALADSPPLRTNTGWTIFVPGYAPKADEPGDSPSVGFVSPGYFATLGIPLLLGRDIDERDVAGKRDVMVVNQTFARHFFANENPVGRRVGNREGVYSWEIIGVVKDSKNTGLREGPIRMLYVPSRPGPWASRTVVHLRTAGNPATLALALRRKVRDLDRSATVFNVHTVQEEFDRALSRERLLGLITGLFGGLALLLAAVGLYGLMSYGVARRTREFGIRIAIGARSGSIVGMVVREAMWLLIAGMAIGLIAARALGRVIRSMLFEVEPADPVSTGLAVLLLVTGALVAVWIPARRASRVDPIRALRWD